MLTSIENSIDQKNFIEDHLDGIWIYNPLNYYFRNKRVRIISDPERFKQDFIEKKTNSSKPNEPLNLPLDLLKKKTMSAGTANANLPKTKKTLVKQLTVNERVTLLQNLNTLKFQNNTKNTNVKLPTIQRASSIKRPSLIQPLPPLRIINNREVEEEHKEYVFKYKYLSPKSIFQKYVEKPLLMDGRKCELRYLSFSF